MFCMISSSDIGGGKTSGSTTEEKDWFNCCTSFKNSWLFSACCLSFSRTFSLFSRKCCKCVSFSLAVSWTVDVSTAAGSSSTCAGCFSGCHVLANRSVRPAISWIVLSSELESIALVSLITLRAFCASSVSGRAFSMRVIISWLAARRG